MQSQCCMKRIVAAPTAGSCGVLPAVMITCQKLEKCPEDEIVKRCLWQRGSVRSLRAGHRLPERRAVVRQRLALRVL